MHLKKEKYLLFWKQTERRQSQITSNNNSFLWSRTLLILVFYSNKLLHLSTQMYKKPNLVKSTIL